MSNKGAIAILELTEKGPSWVFKAMTGDEARALAQNVTGAVCKDSSHRILSS